jgi:hypothetical protein
MPKPRGSSKVSIPKTTIAVPDNYQGPVRVITYYSGMKNFVTSNRADIILPTLQDAIKNARNSIRLRADEISHQRLEPA